LETQVQARLRAEEFKVAIDFFLAARGKHDAAEWSEAIDRRVNELRDRAAQLFASLKDSAVAAQKRRAAPDVQQIRDRILKWGLAEYSSDLQASLAGVAPDPEPVRGPVESALVGSWPLDEGSGTAAADVSGKAGKATLKGATWTTGRAGPAVLLDGSGAHVELPNSPEIDNLQEESYTIAVWFRPDSVPTDPKEPGFGGLAAVLLKPPFREGIVYTHAGKFILIHYLAGAKWTSTGTWSDTFAPGAWYHVAAVVDRPAGMLSIYVNGQVRGKEQIEKGAAAEQYHQEKWTAGKVKHHVDPGYCTKGALCDLRLDQRALDAKEVEALVSSKARSAGDGRAWKRIVDGQSLDGLNGKGFGGWKTESGAVVKDLQVDLAAQTREIIGDGEVRVCFEVKNCTILWFCLRQNGQDGYRVALGAQELQTLAAGPHELVFVAKGDAVTATFDGKPRAVDDSRKSQKGRLHFNASLGADFRISSIDIRPLH
jgi:hypothetical protein